MQRTEHAYSCWRAAANAADRSRAAEPCAMHVGSQCEPLLGMLFEGLNGNCSAHFDLRRQCSTQRPTVLSVAVARQFDTDATDATIA